MKTLPVSSLLMTAVTISFAQPVIVSQPRSQTVSVDANVTLSVNVRQTSSVVQYQWRRDGVDVPGATSRTLQLIGVQYSDQGSYIVEVSDETGSTNSAPARLVVLPRNVIRLGTHEIQIEEFDLSWRASDDDNYPIVTRDGLTFFIGSLRPGGQGGLDIWMATRSSPSEPWGELILLPSDVNSPADDAFPSLSSDGLSLYFTSNRRGGSGTYDIWMTTRDTTSSPFRVPWNLGPAVNSSAEDLFPCISADGLTLFFSSDRPGGYGTYDLWMSTRATPDSPWQQAVNLGGAVNTTGWEITPAAAPDNLTLFFASNTGVTTMSTFAARRPSLKAPFLNRTHVNFIFDHMGHTDLGSVSDDGPTLYVVKDFVELWQFRMRSVPELRRPENGAEAAGDSFNLELIGREAGSYRIEGTADFINWTEIVRTNTSDSSPLSLTFPTSSAEPYRFYRAVGE